MASAGDDHTLRVWDAMGSPEVRSFEYACHGVNSAVFSPDGRRLAAVGAYGFKVWDSATGQEVLDQDAWKLPDDLKQFDSDMRRPGELLSVAFSPDGRHLATASEAGTVRVWDALSGKEILACKGHTDPVRSVCFSPDGTRLASASEKAVKLWDTQSGQEVFSFEAPRGARVPPLSTPSRLRLPPAYCHFLEKTGPVQGVAFSPDGDRLAGVGWDDAIRVWDTRSGREVLSLQGHAGFVSGVAFSPDGRRLASASRDWTARIWDAQTGKGLLTLTGHAGMVWGVAFAPDSRRLVSTGIDNTVKLWDLVTGQEVLSLPRAVWNVAFSPDGKHLAGASEQEVLMWDGTPRGEPAATPVNSDHL
jgi:WD40 repeat protein